MAVSVRVVFILILIVSALLFFLGFLGAIKWYMDDIV